MQIFDKIKACLINWHITGGDQEDGQPISLDTRYDLLLNVAKNHEWYLYDVCKINKPLIDILNKHPIYKHFI